MSSDLSKNQRMFGVAIYLAGLGLAILFVYLEQQSNWDGVFLIAAVAKYLVSGWR